MDDPNRPSGRSTPNMLRESVEIDVGNLDHQQVMQLRQRVQDFMRGLNDVATDFGDIASMSGHSSHHDDDGWI